jgi:predicted transposase YbfD/YdcC
MELQASIKKNGEAAYSIRYFLSNLTSIKEIARAIRLHWGVENGNHWHLDAVFGADSSKTTRNHGAAQLQALKAIAPAP